jgi:hypothetical protein
MCFSQGNFKSMAEFSADGLNFSAASWMRLQSCILHAKALLTKPDPLKDNRINEIQRLFNTRAKGSKKFRTIISMARGNVDIGNLRPVTTFSDLVGLPVPEEKPLKKILSSWAPNYLGNKLREFIFKFRYNYLGLNNRINAFNNQVDPRCNFCRIRDPDTVTRDSLSHFFFECNTTNNILRATLEKYFPDRRTEIEAKMFYWYGICTDNGSHQSINLLIWDIFRFVLFRYKKKRVVPNFHTVEKDLLFFLRTFLLVNSVNKHTFENNEFYARLNQALG